MCPDGFPFQAGALNKKRQMRQEALPGACPPAREFESGSLELTGRLISIWSSLAQRESTC